MKKVLIFILVFFSLNATCYSQVSSSDSLCSPEKYAMKCFLEKDYVIYERFNPIDTLGVLNRFMSVVSPLLGRIQKEHLGQKIIARVRHNRMKNIEKKEVKYTHPSEIIIYGVDITFLLPRVLTPPQYEKVCSIFQACNSYRRDAVFGLHLFRSS